MAKFAYFYGLSFSQVKDLPIDEFYEYWEMITVIEAQEMLKELTIQDWPNQKKNARDKLHKSLYKKAYPSIFKEGQKVSTATLANALMKGSF